MLLAIDTNILINALLSSNDDSKSIRLMDDVFAGLHCMCISSRSLVLIFLPHPLLFIPESVYNNYR